MLALSERAAELGSPSFSSVRRTKFVRQYMGSIVHYYNLQCLDMLLFSNFAGDLHVQHLSIA